jgi:hypothetical protein
MRHRARVPAPEVENLVLGAVREHLKVVGKAEDPISGMDRDLIERHVERITVKPLALEVTLTEPRDGPARTGEHDSEGTDHGGNNHPLLVCRSAEGETRAPHLRRAASRARSGLRRTRNSHDMTELCER